MEISNEMVEAGALVLYNRMRVRRKMRPVAYIGANATPECTECRDEARTMLEAVAPAIRAAAMEDAAKIAEDEVSSSVPRALDNDDYWGPVYRKRIAAAIRAAKEVK